MHYRHNKYGFPTQFLRHLHSSCERSFPLSIPPPRKICQLYVWLGAFLMGIYLLSAYPHPFLLKTGWLCHFALFHAPCSMKKVSECIQKSWWRRTFTTVHLPWYQQKAVPYSTTTAFQGRWIQAFHCFHHDFIAFLLLPTFLLREVEASFPSPPPWKTSQSSINPQRSSINLQKRATCHYKRTIKSYEKRTIKKEP